MKKVIIEESGTDSIKHPSLLSVAITKSNLGGKGVSFLQLIVYHEEKSVHRLKWRP